MDEERFKSAVSAIDEANSEDPIRIVVRGEERPKELAHAALASEWVERLVAEPSEGLRLAARAHHLRRWSLERSDYPEGRRGYLLWREELKQRHARETAQILCSCGYDPEPIERVCQIILRRRLSQDFEAQALEDALCLIFFETQLADLAGQLDAQKLRDVALKTLGKMSSKARELVIELPLLEEHGELLGELIESL